MNFRTFVAALTDLEISALQAELRRVRFDEPVTSIDQMFVPDVDPDYVVGDSLLPQTNLNIDTAEKRLIRDGKFIDAIKAIRCRVGLGLKDAKDVAEEYRDKHFPVRY